MFIIHHLGNHCIIDVKFRSLYASMPLFKRGEK